MQNRLVQESTSQSRTYGLVKVRSYMDYIKIQPLSSSFKLIIIERNNVMQLKLFLPRYTNNTYISYDNRQYVGSIITFQKAAVNLNKFKVDQIFKNNDFDFFQDELSVKIQLISALPICKLNPVDRFTSEAKMSFIGPSEKLFYMLDVQIEDF